MLSRKGKLITCVRVVSEEINPTASATTIFDWKDALLDSIIVGGTTFVTSLVAGLADGGIGFLDLETALIAGALSFMTFLSIKRGLPQSKA